MKTKATTTQSYLRRNQRRIGWLVMLLAGPSLVGCYGHFPITRGVYKLNGAVGGESVGGKILETLVFWAFVIFPIYGIGMFLDAIVFNLIEFWTGNHIELSQYGDGNGTRAALVPNADGTEVRLTVEKDGKLLLTQRFVKVSPTEFEVRNDKDRVVGRVFNDGNGKLRMTDAKSHTLRVIDAGAANPLIAPPPAETVGASSL